MANAFPVGPSPSPVPSASPAPPLAPGVSAPSAPPPSPTPDPLRPSPINPITIFGAIMILAVLIGLCITAEQAAFTFLSDLWHGVRAPDHPRPKPGRSSDLARALDHYLASTRPFLKEAESKVRSGEIKGMTDLATTFKKHGEPLERALSKALKPHQSKDGSWKDADGAANVIAEALGESPRHSGSDDPDNPDLPDDSSE